MTFCEIYNQEKEKAGARPMEFLKRVAFAAYVTVDTAYQWGVGMRSPSKAAAFLVANELGIDAGTLFPKIHERRAQ